MTEPPRNSASEPSNPWSDPRGRAPGRAKVPGFIDFEERWLLPSGAVGKPCSLYVYGDCRPVVNGVAFAMAEMLDLAPLWLEVRDAMDGHDGPSVAEAGWIPPERLFLSEAGFGLEPNDAVANLALGSIVRSDEPAEVLEELTDFLRLPQLVQQAIGAATSESNPRALVVANAERAAQLFPREPGTLRHFVRSILNCSVSLVVAHTGPVPEQNSAFSAGFRVHAPSFATWTVGSLECEKGLTRGPFATGRPRLLSEVPSVVRVLTGIRGSDR